MSPEQYKGHKTDAYTDSWGFGVVLYELLTGCVPFNGISFDHFKDIICNQEPERIENLKENQWKVIKRLLSKDRKSRPLILKDSLIELKKGEVVELREESPEAASSSLFFRLFRFFPDLR